MDVWHQEHCEEPHRCGGQAEESGVESVPKVDQQRDDMSQLGRLDEFEMVIGDTGYVQTGGVEQGQG